MNAATTITPTVLTNLQNGIFDGDVAISGRISGDGSVPPGAIVDFFVDAIPDGWYELNGQAIPRTGAGAALFAIFGTIYGVGDGATTFNLPNINGRYRRSRNVAAGFDLGGTQANQNKTHTHTASGSTSVTVDAVGNHDHGGATGGQSASHTHTGTSDSGGSHTHTGSTDSQGAHTHTVTAMVQSNQGTAGGSNQLGSNTSIDTSSAGAHTHSLSINSGGAHTHGFTTGSTSNDHTHTIAASGSHAHTASGSTTVTVNADGGTECRPDTFVVITCIKG
jgi:microcystin-dependent protein